MRLDVLPSLGGFSLWRPRGQWSTDGGVHERPRHVAARAVQQMLMLIQDRCSLCRCTPCPTLFASCR